MATIPPVVRLIEFLELSPEAPRSAPFWLVPSYTYGCSVASGNGAEVVAAMAMGN